MPHADSIRNKEIYAALHDRIIDKRFKSGSPIRRYAHHAQYNIFSKLVPAGSTVLDAGCGEGVLSVLLAQHGCQVTGVDISGPNIAAAKKYAEEQGVGARVRFELGDAEHLPAGDKSFDYVVSSHVLEHLPDFIKGVAELNRIARKGVVVAIPTCLNLSSMALLGGDSYWAVSRRTPYAVLLGVLRVLTALITGKEGVNEGYQGNMELIHIFRFPWRGKKLMEAGGLKVLSFRGSSYPFPYLSWLLPLSRFLDHFAGAPVIRNFGYGTTYVCIPN